MARTKKGRAVSGIVVINKPLGLSSNQVLQRVKHLFGAQKAGHTGALDPLASGVLPICLGEATKLSQLLLDADKAYDTTARLGEIRSTGDAEGEVVATAPVPELNRQQLEPLLDRFRGEVEQVPPMFSALKLDGKPLYELARQGMSADEIQAVADKKRRVITIHELLLQDVRPQELDLSVRCSKGTYIRTLVEDIGQAIGCGAYVSRLHRTQCGPFHSGQMLTLEQLEVLAAEGMESLDSVLLPPATAIPDWPEVALTLAEADKMLHGQPISTGLNDCPSVQLWAIAPGYRQMIGIGQIAAGQIKAQRLFQVAVPVTG
ncbi:tRNA pseudouridine(55) synthase TruB [Venatoribacter cucullus]|uniref:tRNA pseudouridine(55) synthase TruB n=1 Tax=Venatoribacter cucullus TaxID=2661630 RepID=UPI001938CF0D|nr:tRNA pseudouridine(55) synthase TruB [Venatoribacter cucullus]QQD20863.1 tRNA pseudouridine(55) synthase TruB [Oceanospirillaceae bacterium ASx5O]UZK02998.1 tRNA pseudouridine(55) synthase TruB [Venatoribacter cucullus]